jgi:hypothetical protein
MGEKRVGGRGEAAKGWGDVLEQTLPKLINTV